MNTNTRSFVSPNGVEKGLGEIVKVYRAKFFFYDFQVGDQVNITDRQNRVVNVAEVTGLTDDEIQLVITA